MPSESLEAAASKATASGASPEVGVAVKLATGAWLGAVTSTVAVALPVAPPSSVTVSVTG